MENGQILENLKMIENKETILSKLTLDSNNNVLVNNKPVSGGNLVFSTLAELQTYANSSTDNIVGQLCGVANLTNNTVKIYQVNINKTVSQIGTGSSPVDLSEYITILDADNKYELKDSTIVKDSNYIHTDNNYTNADKTNSHTHTNKTVIDKFTEVSGQPYYNGSAIGGSSYSLPIATNSVLGGVKSGTNTTIDTNGVITVNSNAFESITGSQNKVDSAITTLKDGVSTDGNTLNKLRNLISGIQTLLNSDDTTLDSLQEIVSYMKANKTILDGVTINKINISDIIDDLLHTDTNKPLSANQGKILKDLLDALTIVVSGKEPTIVTKNTAFNKNYGTTLTDVLMNGTQSLGIKDEIARIDHVHPTDTTKLPLAMATPAIITTATYSITSMYSMLKFDCTTNPIVVTMPSASAYRGRHVTVAKIDSSVNTLTINPTGSDKINGVTTFIMSGLNNSAMLITDGSNWNVVGSSKSDDSTTQTLNNKTLSNTILTGNLIPNVTNILNLGSPIINYANLYARNIASDSTLNLTSANANNLSIISGTTGTLTLDSETTGTVNLGTNANAKTINIGNNNNFSSLNILSGNIKIGDINNNYSILNCSPTGYLALKHNTNNRLYVDSTATTISSPDGTKSIVINNGGISLNGYSGTGISTWNTFNL